MIQQIRYLLSPHYLSTNIVQSQQSGLVQPVVLIDNLKPLKPFIAFTLAAVSNISNSSNTSGLPPLQDISSPIIDPRGTFLSLLNKWLSRNWIDTTLITEKAKKADNAEIPTHLWDCRIYSVLEVNTHCFPSLCRSFHFGHKNVIWYMDDKNGEIWLDWCSFPLNQFHYPSLFTAIGSAAQQLGGGSLF